MVDQGDDLDHRTSIFDSGLDEFSEEDLALLDSSDVEVEDYSNLEESHWLFETSTLVEKLQPVCSVIKDKQELVSRVVCLTPTDGGINCTANTGDIFVQVKIPLVNVKNPLDKTYIIEFKNLYSVIRNAGAKFLLKDVNGSLEASVLGGTVQFECFNLDLSLFEFPEKVDSGKLTEYDTTQMMKFLPRASASMALAVRPDDRRIRVQDGTSYASFVSSIFTQRNLLPIDFSLRASDLIFLLKFFGDSGTFKFAELSKYYYFETAGSLGFIPKTETMDLESVKEVADNIKKTYSVTVSPVHFYRIVLLIKSMIGNMGVIRLVAEDGTLTVKAANKPLSFGISAIDPAAKFEILASVSAVGSTLIMFRKEPVVTVAVDEQKLIFEGDDMDVIFGSII